MSEIRHVAVIDIGKTNAKLVLVDFDENVDVAVRKRHNSVIRQPPYPHYDTDGLWTFIIDSLAELQRVRHIDAICVTTHGASAALLRDDGMLAAPVLDYEYDGPDELADSYDACRPGFAETGSPRLPMGLNLGAQLFWIFNRHNDIAARTSCILTYPQYWSYRLTGIAANEVSSLGCHTDLWCPFDKRFSSLVDDQGWKSLMAPVRKAADILGPITADVAVLTGIDPATPVACGIHDSNASLYPHLRSRKAPFAVVSTGTWVISMSIGVPAEGLDPSRDTLVNVDAFGQPVPSARFMGGREFELLMKGRRSGYQPEDIDRVLATEFMRLPSMETRSGPFQGVVGSWTADQAMMSAGEYYVAVSFYLGLMTATGLADTHAEGPVLVEGPFADNHAYLEMLASATGRPVFAISGTGTSNGAALLLASGDKKISQSTDALTQPSPAMNVYAESWHRQVTV